MEEEQWLLGERRGQNIDPQDPELIDRVCDIVKMESKVVRVAVESEFEI